MCGRLLIRVDAGAEIGAGHLMRCLAIAAEWKRRGGDCAFLLFRSTDMLNERISSSGCDIVHLASDNPSDVIQACSEFSAQFLLVDGYHFDADYRCSLQQVNIPVVLIDDSIIEPPWNADLIINPQPRSAACDYIGMPEERLLLGLEYLPVRQEFHRQYELGVLPLHERRHILLNFGGTDPARLTLPVATRLAASLPDNTHLDIIMSKEHPDYPAVVGISASMPDVVHVHSDVSNMAELMGQAGLALSAGGSTLWELASLQVPVLAVLVAENQRVITRYPYWCGLFDATGGISKGLEGDIVNRTLNLWQDEALRQKYATRLAELKLLSGSSNICSRLCRYLHDEG